jgi:dipeptidase E
MKIVAIGGGEIGRPGTSIETEAIDREIIKLSNKQNPTLLFLPTASHDSDDYVEVVQKYFGGRLGCNVHTLRLWNDNLSLTEMETMILSADIIYVGGGNTREMIDLWQKKGLDKLLKQAGDEGIVLSGLSAGAVCWFKESNSDSEKIMDPDADYIKIDCLNFVPLFVCPHFDMEKDREPSLKKMLEDAGGAAIAIDNCAALKIIDNTYQVIRSKPGASAYLCFWERGKFIKRNLNAEEKLPLENLLMA